MTGISGCFGAKAVAAPLSDIGGVGSAVADIEQGAGLQPNPSGSLDESVAATVAVLGVMHEYARRVRILTWAVVALALVYVLREME